MRFAMTTAASAVITASTAFGQFKVADVDIPATRINSIVAKDGQIVLSRFQSSQQSIWNASNPFSPTMESPWYDPPNGDQWHDAHYYKGDIGEFVFQACRFGGLNMMDVSNPSAVTLAGSATTNYHWNGIDTWTNPNTNKVYLAYSESRTSSTSPSGLRLFEVTAAAPGLIPAGTSFNIYQCFDLKFSPDGRYVYQLVNVSNIAPFEVRLLTYDLGSPTSASYPTPTPHSDTFIASGGGFANGSELEISSSGTRLTMALGDYGLWCADVTNPSSPAMTMLFPGSTNLYFETLETYHPWSDIVIGTVRDATLPDSSVLYAVGFPGGGKSWVPLFVAPTLSNIWSLYVDQGLIYTAGSKTSTSVGNFQIWR